MDKVQRKLVLDGIKTHLVDNDPSDVTRNKFALRRPSAHTERELRLNDWRVFYTVMDAGELAVVNWIGEKRNNKLFVDGEEFELMKIESLRTVKNNFSEVVESLHKTGPIVVTKNGRSAALLIPIDENTDLETLILSNSPRFWNLLDRAASGKRTPMEALPDPDDDSAWKRLGREKRVPVPKV